VLGPAEACFLCIDTIRSARSSPAGIRLGLEGPAGPGYDVISMTSFEYWCKVSCAHYSGVNRGPWCYYVTEIQKRV
jgi:hypothetical protein